MAIVFVYGTLKKGFNNEPLLSDQKFLGKAVLADENFKMYEVEGYYKFPALVECKDGNGYKIFGEVYEVDDACLASLDRLEGVDHGLYERILVDVHVAGGELLKNVFVYKFKNSVKNYKHCGPAWPIKELLRFQRVDRSLICDSCEKSISGVALWNLRTDSWQTDAFETEELLNEFCSKRFKAFGVTNPINGFYSRKYFEVRPRSMKVVQKSYYIESVDGDSPKFENGNDLFNWASENMTFFGGLKGSASQWHSVFAGAFEKHEE